MPTTVKKIIDRIYLPVWLLVFLCLILILRIPSFFEPYSYGDEMIYLTLGQGIRQGLHLYSGIFDNKPPLIYLIAALAGNLFWFKAVLAAWNIATIILFWKLAGQFFSKDNRLPKIATVIFGLLTTLPLLEGNIVNAELFFIGLNLAAFLTVFSLPHNLKNLLLAGSLFGLATLFKVPASFDLPVIIIFWLIASLNKQQTLHQLIRQSFLLILGFLIPIIISCLWFTFQGNLSEYIKTAFLQNIGYLSTFRPDDVPKPFLARNLPLLIRATIVLIGSLILILKRKALSWQFSFLCLWVLFALFAVSLSERPYPHYLLQAVAPTSLLIAVLISQKNLEQSLAVIPLFLVVLVPVYFRYYYYPTTSYYLRFINLISGKITKDQYLQAFSSATVGNYQIARFVLTSTSKKDRVFVLGDSAPLYALTKRLPTIKYIADYHISDFSSINQEVNQMFINKPEMIIILKGAQNYQALGPLLKQAYFPISEVKEAEVWKKLDLKIQ